MLYHMENLTLQVPEMKIAEFVNSVDYDEVAHYDVHRLDFHNMINNQTSPSLFFGQTDFVKFQNLNYIICTNMSLQAAVRH